jgi:hypothetical protein
MQRKDMESFVRNEYKPNMTIKILLHKIIYFAEKILTNTLDIELRRPVLITGRYGSLLDVPISHTHKV